MSAVFITHRNPDVECKYWLLIFMTWLLKKHYKNKVIGRKIQFLLFSL